MDNERLEIILSNLLGEIHDKTFDGNSEEFISWLNTEIGMTYSEMGMLSIKDRFPLEARKHALKEVFADLVK